MLKNKDNFLKALDYAYRLLAVRERTEFEIKKRLGEKGCKQDVIEEVVEYLKKRNELNDAQFIQAWIKDRSTVRPKGILAIKDELLKKGVDMKMIDAALKDRDTGYNEYEVARALTNKKLESLEELNRLARKKRIYTYLAQRGFSFDVINEVVDKI